MALKYAAIIAHVIIKPIEIDTRSGRNSNTLKVRSFIKWTNTKLCETAKDHCKLWMTSMYEFNKIIINLRE